MLHIRDVEGPKKTGSVETRLEAMEQQVFKCQGMVERGLNANHTMITEFTSNHKIDAIDIGKHLSRLYDKVDQLQGQIYDLQNQNCEYEYRFKSIRIVVEPISHTLSFFMFHNEALKSIILVPSS
ncbi:40S ribosomal protein S5-1 [Hordeum vulgare]|nr:40S ribosomal protein S5-1 [Hordeum vulgare]